MDYKKLIEDSNEGFIDWDVVTLVMDNDGGYWKCNTGDEDADERYATRLEERYGSPQGYKDIVEVLNAAGINSDWC